MRTAINLTNLAVGVVKQSSIQQAADVVGSQFVKNEAVLYRLSQDDAKQVFSLMMKKFYESSSMVYNRATGEIYGCTLACDLVADDLDETEYPQSLDPVIQLMDQINPRYYEAIGLTTETVRLNQIFYQVFTGVKPEMRGMKMAQRLLLHNTSLAKILGFQHIRGDFSSNLSYNVGLKIGYKHLFDIDYATIEVDAEPRNYWSDVPKLIKEDKLVVGNVFLDEFQISLNRNDNINQISGQNINLKPLESNKQQHIQQL